MNKFIQSTKQFFNKKPVRIVVALLIIAAIMTGIAFGIMALIGAFKDPCQSGYHYDNNLKVCVKDGCKNICGTDRGDHQKGDCLSDDYCNYSISGIEYKFDKESCKCFGICSSDNEIAKTENGDDTTSMRKTESGWEPVNPLRCGLECNFNKSGICENEDTHCGISITKDGVPMPLAGPKDGCIYKNDIEICSTDENIVCSNDGGYKCSSTENDIYVSKYKYSTKTYCFDTNKCGMDDSSKEHICRIGSNDCGQGNDCTSHPVFLNKGIYKLGVCSNKNDISRKDKRCQNPINIGEHKFSPTASSWEDVAFVTKSGMEGVSLNQPQCDLYSPQCKKIDTNAPWFCLTGDLTSCNYGNPPGTSCEENPPVSSISEAEGDYSFKNPPNCCDKKNLSTLGNGSFCCPLNAFKDESTGKYLCLNASKYPPDPSWVELSTKKCTTNKDCSTEENINNLYTKLKINITNSADYPQNTNHNASNYADLYCDNGECKFFAGYVDKVTDGKLGYAAKWMVGDDDTTQTSAATYIDPNKKSWQGIQFPYNMGQKLNFCQTTSDTIGKFGIYEDDGSPSTDLKHTTPYKSIVNVSKTDSSKVTNLECLNYAKSILPEAYWYNYIKSDGSVNTGSIKNNGYKCEFEADCVASSFETSLSPTGNLKWNFGPDEVRNLSGKEITLADDGKATPVKFATYPKYAESNWKNACQAYLGGQQCDVPYIPSAWSGLENNFVNICKTNSRDQRYCEYNDAASDSSIYLIKPTINGEQHCSSGVDFSTEPKSFECN